MFQVSLIVFLSLTLHDSKADPVIQFETIAFIVFVTRYRPFNLNRIWRLLVRPWPDRPRTTSYGLVTAKRQTTSYGLVTAKRQTIIFFIEGGGLQFSDNFFSKKTIFSLYYVMKTIFYDHFEELIGSFVRLIKKTLLCTLKSLI